MKRKVTNGLHLIIITRCLTDFIRRVSSYIQEQFNWLYDHVKKYLEKCNCFRYAVVWLVPDTEAKPQIQSYPAKSFGLIYKITDATPGSKANTSCLNI